MTAVPAGRRHGPRSQQAAWLGAAAAIAGILGLTVAAVLGVFAGSAAPVTGIVPPARGPSAGQLAHGRWISVPAAPFKLCDPVAVWDGRALVVVEPGVRVNVWCPARAATYDPRTNTWTGAAAPPDMTGHQVGAWGGGRLVLVTTRNGKAVSWSAAGGRWQRLPRVPAGGLPSITWTGRGFLVIMTRGRHATPFMLTGRRWTRLADLPQPAAAKGSIEETAAAVSRGAVYVLADVGHVAPPSGYVELFRRTAAGWTRVPAPSGAPSSQFTLTTVAGGMVAAGSACPGKGGCTVDLESLAILRPGAHPDVTALHTPPGVPAPSSVAAGAEAVVVTNPRIAAAATPYGPTRHCLIYDLATGTWHRGPDTPTPDGGVGTYWTPDGVISLGQSGSGSRAGGWLLQPARHS